MSIAVFAVEEAAVWRGESKVVNVVFVFVDLEMALPR